MIFFLSQFGGGERGNTIEGVYLVDILTEKIYCLKNDECFLVLQHLENNINIPFKSSFPAISIYYFFPRIKLIVTNTRLKLA